MSFLPVMLGHFNARTPVECEPLLEARLAVRLDGVDWALGLANPAVDALCRVYDEHVLGLDDGGPPVVPQLKERRARGCAVQSTDCAKPNMAAIEAVAQ